MSEPLVLKASSSTIRSGGGAAGGGGAVSMMSKAWKVTKTQRGIYTGGKVSICTHTHTHTRTAQTRACRAKFAGCVFASGSYFLAIQSLTHTHSCTFVSLPLFRLPCCSLPLFQQPLLAQTQTMRTNNHNKHKRRKNWS